MTEPFVAQLAEICAAEPTRAKWVFVPGHDVGLALGDRLALAGRDWANLRFVTPLDIATRMAAPFLLERGIDPSGETLGPALIMRLMLDRASAGGYFRPMIEHAGMAQALWRTISELRYAGIRASELARNTFTPLVSKREELVALLSAYECYLESHAVADMPAVFEEALGRRDWCPVAADDVVVELPDATWSPVVRRFLDSISCRRVAPRVAALPETAPPARSASLKPRAEPVTPDAPTDASRLRFLNAPAAAGPRIGDGSLAIFHAGGRDAEVDEVFRRILASGRSVDEVEIACASDVYQPLVREKASRFGLRVTASAGTAGPTTRAGRLLARYADWIAGNFDAGGLRRLLQAGDCKPAIGGEGAEVSPGQAARLLLRAKASAGRATYAPALTRVAEQDEWAANNIESTDEDRAWKARTSAQARALLEWIEDVLATVPQADESEDGTIALCAVIEGARRFLRGNTTTASALDHAGLDALVGSLDELRVLGDYRCSLAEALVFLRERVASLVVGRERPRPGHLHVSSLVRAGYSGRPLVFVVGLQEGGVFPPMIEDAVLLDAERRAISPLLATSTDRQDEAVAAVLSRLAAIGLSAERVCLSFSCFDSREFRETFPSWIVLQACRLVEANATLTYEDLGSWLGEPASPVPLSDDKAASDAGWWLAQRVGDATRRAAVQHAYPPLARGMHADEQRASAAFTEFDGYVAVAGPALDPSNAGRPISPTSLESAAKCPLRFFMERGLGVRVIEENKAGEDGWLDAATKGTELHKLFAAIMRVVRDEKRKPNLGRDGAQLLDWGRTRLAELRQEMPPPSAEVCARESEEFLGDLEAFIEAECEGRHGTDPVGLEVGFGFALKDAEGETLASPDPVLITLGNGRAVLTHGRIDRINRTGPGEYEVVDYKTGGYWPDAWKGHFAGGTRLQHAIYGVAAARLLRRDDPTARVGRGVYIFPALKGHRQRKEIPAPSTAKLASVLRDLADVIAAGAYVSSDGEDACRWCEFKAACHAQDVSHAQAKRENPDNTMLEPFARLRRDHE